MLVLAKEMAWTFKCLTLQSIMLKPEIGGGSGNFFYCYLKMLLPGSSIYNYNHNVTLLLRVGGRE